MIRSRFNGSRRNLITAAAAMTLLLPLTRARAAAPAAAGEQHRALPNLRVTLDGQRVDVGPVLQDGDDFLVPLGKAVTVLGRGRARPDADSASPYQITVNGRTVLQLPTNGDRIAVSLGARRVVVNDPPERVVLAGEPRERLMMDLKTLAGLLGVTMDVDGASVVLFTPEFWGKKLALGPSALAGRTFQNLPLLPEMGVSPPARSLLVWVRPPEKAVVQIYKLSSGTPVPLLGVNSFGKRTLHPQPPFDQPRPWTSTAERPVRVETLFYNVPPPTKSSRTYGAYVALISRHLPASGDLRAAIQKGQIADGDWAVVGVRQVVARGIIRYQPYHARNGETPETIARKYRMPAALLRDLSGLRFNEPIEAGEPVVVIQDLDTNELKRRQAAAQSAWVETGLYEAEPGDTVVGLARRCGVSLAQFQDANTALATGAELEPGEIVTLIRPKVTSPPKQRLAPPRTNVTPVVAAPVTINRPVALRQGSAPGAPVVAQLPAGTALTVTAMVSGNRSGAANRFRVLASDLVGTVAVADLPRTFRPVPLPRVPAPGAFDPGITLAAGQQVVAEALRWVGVPRYEWGGNQINKGIDCSHYVAAVFARVGQPVPSPPVHNMERFGRMVHWKAVPVEEFGAVETKPAGPPLANLRPGDRIIFQGNPTSARAGNHHIGIYVGPYKNMAHAVVHCNSSHNTVSVNELTDGYLWRIYRYAVRGAQPRTPGQIARRD